MAGTVASPLLDVLCDRLDSHVTALSANFIQIRLKLAETQAILEDTITERGGSDQIPSIRIWLTVLRDLAYDIDVLIDDWERSRKSKATCSLPTSLNNSKIDQEVRRIHGRLVRHLNLLRELVSGVQVAGLECSNMSIRGSQIIRRYVQHCSVLGDFTQSTILEKEKLRTLLLFSGIGKLKLLRKLPAFILGKRRDSANLQELNFLNLEGRLDIKNLENVRDEIDGYEAKLHEKVHIHSLGLSWSRDAITRDDISTTHVIHSLRPPQDLKVLDLKGYRGAMIPSWLNSGLTNLVKVSITDCSFEKLPPLGQIPTLKDLCIKGLSAVQIIGHDFYGKGTVRGFPSLRQLELYDMPNLWEWECLTMEKMGGEITIQAPFPSLEKLIIEGCNMLIALPFTQHLKNLALCNSNEMLL
ncbi:hypothetical protein Pint_26080 [Pistacia integerrima]|uniref:Uncharacterized protein n=1 Tax=Pistacia integerrima TaxID=434235 RepID=A0ACC0YF27_9ROSI|nr:hypothetical protein Pint_26080 [Pistacia integerrima]